MQSKMGYMHFFLDVPHDVSHDYV